MNRMDIRCPVCGYYCLGNGGIGCIDKPSLVYGLKHATPNIDLDEIVAPGADLEADNFTKGQKMALLGKLGLFLFISALLTGILSAFLGILE